jgi:hypothetical protein
MPASHCQQPERQSSCCLLNACVLLLPRRQPYHDGTLGEGWTWFVQKEQRTPQVRGAAGFNAAAWCCWWSLSACQQ